MKTIVAILMACVALTACNLPESDKVIPVTLEYAGLAQRGCAALGTELKDVVLIERSTKKITTIKISCMDGSIRIEADFPIVPEVVVPQVKV